jgi:hypothetical protein
MNKAMSVTNRIIEQARREGKRHLADPETKIIVAYVESIQDG